MFAELKRRIINGGTLSTRLSGRLACTWLVLGVAISAVPAASGAQVPVSCPRVYYFNDIGTLTTEWNGKY